MERIKRPPWLSVIDGGQADPIELSVSHHPSQPPPAQAASEPPRLKAYVAGPMRGVPFFNFPAFHATAKRLRERGWEVRNPAERDETVIDMQQYPLGTEPVPPGFMEEAFTWDVESILWADAIVLLPRWRDSEGANLEVAIGRATGKAILDSGSLRPVRTEPVTLEAHRLVNGARQKNYGHPFDDFSRTAKIWEGILGVEVTPEQVALCQIGIKMSRLVETPGHRDSQVDICGYAETYELVRRRR